MTALIGVEGLFGTPYENFSSGSLSSISSFPFALVSLFGKVWMNKSYVASHVRLFDDIADVFVAAVLLTVLPIMDD
jgi:hypothetical protein